MPQEGTDVMANDHDARGNLGVWLGEELRCARLAAGYTSQDQFARELGFDRTVIVKAETGRARHRKTWRPGSRSCSPTCVTGPTCGSRRSRGTRTGRSRDGSRTGSRSRRRRHSALVEAVADPWAAPDRGLCAAGLSTWRWDSPDEVEAEVAIRLGRQSVLASADFRVLLDKSVLHRRIGAPEVMAMQLEHLLYMKGTQTVLG